VKFVARTIQGSACKFGTVVALLSLSACGWVDSTGNQSESPLPLINSSLVIVDDGGSIRINENTQRTVAFSSADNRLSNWSWKLLEGQADIQNCSRFEDFELPIASNSLRQTCASSGSCEIKLEEQIVDNVTQFNITTPQMRAPAALELLFTANDRVGAPIERRQLVCAIPINEAPDAVDDVFTVTRGTLLSVSGGDEQSLLTNDIDDEDVRNLDLRVNTAAVVEPLFAVNFQLFSDGGFIYEPRPEAPLSENGSISDRFVYSVTDGSSTNSATVSIKITDFNTAPTLITELPDIQATIIERNNDIALFNIRNYFNDAEFDALSFSANQSSLPESGNVYLTSQGLLVGRPENDDSGRYFVTLSASDSIASVDASFYLNIVRGNGSNSPPTAEDIDNTSVRGQFRYDITEFFSDDDEDHLSFTAFGLPPGVEISPDGIIFGTSMASNRGRSFIRVFANDGNGGIVNDGFILRIR